jgi:hypothetical protein
VRGCKPSLKRTIWRWLDEIHQRNMAPREHTDWRKAGKLVPYMNAFVKECGGEIPEHLLPKRKEKTDEGNETTQTGE